MTERAIDAEYLRYQYGDSEKLRVRQETHRLWSERDDDFFEWVLDRLAPGPGDLIADIGCGPGAYHAQAAARARGIVAIDASAGMLEDVVEQARAGRLPVLAVQAGAEQLPLASGSVARVMANHMLYHVTDRIAALQEMRRVLRPGGRVVLATNAANQNIELALLHRQAARRVGYDPVDVTGLSNRFSLDDLALVQQVFPEARRFVREDAFIFPRAAPALRYYATARVDAIVDAPADGSHRPPLLAAMEELVEEIIEREGVLRVSKDAGCFVAER